jgi:poly-gamma-glutamate synthesis protein (capsule biosynthesis protein)
VHWGANWGYSIAKDQRDFAHQLIDEAGVDAIFGHSSHHPLGIEVYRNKLIIYGAGDFFNDYEGIEGHEEYRGELTLMYFPEFELDSGELVALKMFPMEIEKLRLNKASAEDREWLHTVLNREGQQFGTEVKTDGETMYLEWE